MTAEVKKQAEQRINSRFIMCVLWSSQFSIEEYSTRSSLCKLCTITKNSRKQEISWVPQKKQNYGPIGALEDEQCKIRLHEQRYVQSVMEEFDRIGNEKWTFVAPFVRRDFCLDRIYSADVSFHNEYEWESDFPDGGAGANVYVFDTGINVNNGDSGGRAINRYVWVSRRRYSLCAASMGFLDNERSRKCFCCRDAPWHQ